MKTKKQRTDIEWRPTDAVIRERQELAEEAVLAGICAYIGGAVEGELLGDALSLQIETAAQAMKLCKAALDDRIFTPDQVDEIVRRYFFRFGIYRGFRARSSGRLQQDRSAVDEKK